MRGKWVGPESSVLSVRESPPFRVVLRDLKDAREPLLALHQSLDEHFSNVRHSEIFPGIGPNRADIGAFIRLSGIRLSGSFLLPNQFMADHRWTAAQFSDKCLPIARW